MAVEKKFVQDGFTKALVDEYLAKELVRAGYGGMVMNRTPMGTQITVYAEKPGMVIGKGGKLIRKVTRDLDRKFHLDNPQIDVQDVGRGDLNARVVANRLASSLEHGWYFRKAGQSTLRRVMDSGALGCEIVISGKLTGPRSRVEKFLSGYIKHAGKPAEQIVDTGYSVAVKKLGAIGCQVRIVQPDATLPDEFKIVVPPEAPESRELTKQATVAPAAPEMPAEKAPQASGSKSELDKLLESPPQETVKPIVSEEAQVEAGIHEGSERSTIPEVQPKKEEPAQLAAEVSSTGASDKASIESKAEQ